MNVIKTIPIENIQPFAGQPRSYFDPQALQELADSIRTQGQYTPAWVVLLEKKRVGVDKYELVAGERRWRACQLAGVKTLICEVRTYETKAERYVASVMENFGRVGCTTMETARAVGQLLKVHKSAMEVATIFSRSEAWIRQMSLLNRLESEVAAMLEPPNATITTQVGVTLANLQPDVQLRLAREISERGMRHRVALAYVRNNVTDEHRVSKKGGKRRPSDDFNILSTFLKVLGPTAQNIMALGDVRLKAMFVHRAVKDKDIVLALLKRRIEQLHELEALLQ